MKLANTKTKLVRAFRAAVALLLISSFSSSFAQAPLDTPEAQLARANKESVEALEIVKNNDFKSAPLAITKLQSAEQTFAGLGQKERQLGALFLIEHLQFVLDQKEAGLATVAKALALAKEIDKREMQVRIFARAGEYLFKNGKGSFPDREKAQQYIEQAVAVIEKMDPKPDPLSYDTYELLGRLWMSFYNPAKANAAFLSAYKLRKDKPPAESIPEIIKYAEWQIKMGYPKFAVAPLDDARRKSIAAKLPDLEALCTWRMGDLMAGTFRDLKNAKWLLERTDTLLAANPDAALSAKMNLSWGKYYFASFDLTKAGQYFERAMNPNARVKPVGLEGELFLRYGILDYTIGRYDTASQLLQKAVEVNKREGHELAYVESLRYLALCLKSQGKIEEAQKTMTLAVQASGDAGIGWTSSERVAVLIDHADFFIEAFQRSQKDPRFPLGQLPRARNYIELAYQTAKRERMKDLMALAAARFAFVNSLLGDKAKALELLNESLITSRSAGLLVNEAGAMSGLMELSVSMGNTGAATFYGKSAVNIYQQLRKRISDVPAEARASYLSTIESTYRKLVSLLIEQGRIAEAEQVLTMLKEEELMDYVRRDDAVAKNMLQTLPLTESERSAITRYDAIAEQITALGKEMEELEKERRKYVGDAFPKQQRYDELKQQIADASLTFQKFLESLKLTFGKDDGRVKEVSSGLKSLLYELDEPRTAAVSMIVGTDLMNIIVTTSKTQRAHTVKVTAKEVNNLVGDFHSALTSPQYDPRPAGQKLYDLIVKPIESDLAGIKADKILWSMDGSLRYIPPAALWDKTKGYMVERFANVMINLASQKYLDKPRTPGQLSALGVGVSKPVEGFSALSAVPDELDCIVSDKAAGVLSLKPQCTNGVLNGKKLLDEKFTLTNFAGELGRYPIVHIASHFKLTPGDDKNSFLLLGGGEDRKFTVEKLRAEPLNGIDLVVLSACNTATPGGPKTNGVEVEGFGSVAQEEGAKAVMATLWAVADISTKDFMVEFYRLYGKEGLSKADAIRRAQLKLMYGKYAPAEALKVRADEFVTATDKDMTPYKADPKAPFAHPFYWSPFTLSGNWR